MEFFINHTRKQIEFAGVNAHLNKFLDRLLELVDANGWSLKDDVQLYIYDIDTYNTENLRVLLEEKNYTVDAEFWDLFCPSNENVYGNMVEAYEREVERDVNHYGEDGRGWSGWDTPGATCDV